MTRPTPARRFAAVLTLCWLAASLGGKGVEAASDVRHESIATAAQRARLTARPRPPGRRTLEPVAAGVYPLAEGPRGGVLVVPPGYNPNRPAPVFVFLHGAGGDRQQGLRFLRKDVAGENGLLIVPESERGSWDFIVGEYGADVANLDRALGDVFARFNVDPSRVVISGFSDGASYAASLGLANGDVFTHVIAFSPGFAAPPETHGAAKFFVSHGVEDRVLPIQRTSRTLVPKLEKAGLTVRYVEFEGGHVVPPSMVTAALRWVNATAGK